MANTKAPLRQPINKGGLVDPLWHKYFASNQDTSFGSSPTFVDLTLTGDLSVSGETSISGNLTTTGGRIKNTTRVSDTYTILVTDENVYGDTDLSSFTMTLPAGVDGQHLKVMNTGTGLNILTLSPNGTDLLIGENSDFDLYSGDALDLVYQTDEGWA